MLEGLILPLVLDRMIPGDRNPESRCVPGRIHLGSYLGVSWLILACLRIALVSRVLEYPADVLGSNFKGSLVIVRSSWECVGSILGFLGLSWDTLGATWDDVGMSGGS